MASRDIRALRPAMSAGRRCQIIDRYHRPIDSPSRFWRDRICVFVYRIQLPAERGARSRVGPGSTFAHAIGTTKELIGGAPRGQSMTTFVATPPEGGSRR